MCAAKYHIHIYIYVKVENECTLWCDEARARVRVRGCAHIRARGSAHVVVRVHEEAHTIYQS